MLDALCLEYPGVNFFADPGGRYETAKAVCARCLVLRECRDYALDRAIDDGIWGGTSARDRKVLRAEKRDDA